MAGTVACASSVQLHPARLGNPSAPRQPGQAFELRHLARVRSLQPRRSQPVPCLLLACCERDVGVMLRGASMELRRNSVVFPSFPPISVAYPQPPHSQDPKAQRGKAATGEALTTMSTLLNWSSRQRRPPSPTPLAFGRGEGDSSAGLWRITVLGQGGGEEARSGRSRRDTPTNRTASK